MVPDLLLLLLHHVHVLLERLDQVQVVVRDVVVIVLDVSKRLLKYIHPYVSELTQTWRSWWGKDTVIDPRTFSWFFMSCSMWTFFFFSIASTSAFLRFSSLSLTS
jgi:hypothetical protein